MHSLVSPCVRKYETNVLEFRKRASEKRVRDHIVTDRNVQTELESELQVSSGLRKGRDRRGGRE